MKSIIGITDATGMIYALRLLETFQQLNIQTCLIVSREAEATLVQETNYSLAHYKSLAHHFCFDDAELLPDCEWDADSMIIIPCRAASIAPIVHDSPLNFLQKAAVNILKIQKKLILAASEPVFLPEHLKILLEMAYRGATIMPYMPSFYHKPASINDVVNHHTGRILDLLDIEHNMVKRWGEKPQ